MEDENDTWGDSQSLLQLKAQAVITETAHFNILLLYIQAQ